MAEHREPDDIDHGFGERLVAYWRDLEPVRARVYLVLVAVVALLVFRGYLTADESLYWVGIGAALLGAAGTETARRVVDSPATRGARALAWQEHAADEYARGCRDALHASPDGGARCHDIRSGRRCLLDLGHEGVHLIPTE